MALKSFAFSLPVLLAFSGFTTPGFAMDKSLVEAGSKVYFNRCMHCHGEKGLGDGHLIGALKVKPTDLTQLDNSGCVTKKVLGAVLGQHKTGYDNSKMPPLKEVLDLEKVYAVSAYIETLQK